MHRVALTVLLGLSVSAFAFLVQERTIAVPGGCAGLLGFGAARATTLAVAEYRPERGPVLGDIVYFHGFADAQGNHRALFDAWTAAGFRVIAWDYPGHGRTRAVGPRSIGGYGVGDLSSLGRAVERLTVEDEQRPLLLAGWSTGGLVALTWVNDDYGQYRGPRRPRSLILHAPGVALRTPVGRWSWRYPLGEVTLATLSHDEESPVAMPIHPASPGSVPGFAFNLWWTARRVAPMLPADIPFLVLVGGDEEDRYVNTREVLRWSRPQAGASYSMQFPGARHWLDREPEALGGREVIAVSAAFAQWTITRARSERFTFVPRHGAWR